MAASIDLASEMSLQSGMGTKKGKRWDSSLIRETLSELSRYRVSSAGLLSTHGNRRRALLNAVTYNLQPHLSSFALTETKWYNLNYPLSPSGTSKTSTTGTTLLIPSISEFPIHQLNLRHVDG